MTPIEMIETDEDRERDATLEAIALRLVRLETRLVTLMAHLGMKVPIPRPKDRPEPGKEEA